MSARSRQVVLVTVSGKDRPGITHALTGVLAESKATVLDIGQAVINGLLSLTIIFEIPPLDTEKATIKDLLYAANEMGLKLDFQVLSHDQIQQTVVNRGDRYALTLIAQHLTAQIIHDVTAILSRHKVNIDRIQRLSDSAFSCIEMALHSTAPLNRANLKKELLSATQTHGVDIALQTEGLFRRSKRLIVFDMDSTLIQNEVIDEFAKLRGVFNEVAKITEQAMRGQMDFDSSLRQRCQMLKGLTKEDIDKAYDCVSITPGTERLISVLQRLGFSVALISGGFMSIAQRLKDKLNINYVYANKMEFQDGQFTGNILPPLINAQRKADLLEIIAQQEGIHLEQVVAVGDGANDILMLEKAGLGIAFNAKPAVRERADLSLNQKNLDSIFYLLGISGRDVQEVLRDGPFEAI